MNRRTWGLCVLLVAAAGVGAYYARFALIDDAYISFRYAQNLLAGHGLVFNPGERVEGYTNFLWVMLLAGARALGVGFETASQVLGGGFGLLALVALTDFVPRSEGRPAWSVLLAPALFVATLAPMMWAVHGLETALFMALLALAVRADLHGLTDGRPRPSSAVWFALASLARPEGLPLFLARLGLGVLLEGPAYRRRGGLVHGAIYLAILVPFFLGRLAYYGEPLPNTFYAKVGLSSAVVVHGLKYVEVFLASWGSLLFVALVPAVRAALHERRTAYALGMLVAGLGVVVLEGGDVFWAFRFIVPLCPLLYFAVQEGVFEASRWLRGRALSAALAGAVLVTGALHAAHVGRFAQLEAEGADEFVARMKLVGRSLREHLPPTATIAVNAAGTLPFVSGLRTIDMLGMTDAHIAHRRVPLGGDLAGHQKGDGRYVLSRRPEVILLGGVTVVRELPEDLTQMRWRLKHRSEQEMARLPALGREYVADALPLADGRYVVFMRRRDFALPDAGPGG